MPNGRGRNPTGRVEHNVGFDGNHDDSPKPISGSVRKWSEGGESSNGPEKKPRVGYKSESESQKCSSTLVVGSDPRDHASPLRSSSSVASSISNNPSFLDVGKEVARDLRHELDAEGGIYVVNPQLSATMKHLEEMSKNNPDLQIGLEMFTSAFKFLKTILLVKELTKP